MTKQSYKIKERRKDYPNGIDMFTHGRMHLTLPWQPKRKLGT